jgi:mycofactocin precursor
MDHRDSRRPEVDEPRDGERPPTKGPGGDERREPVLIERELLVEEISIDGMCGVY